MRNLAALLREDRSCILHGDLASVCASARYSAMQLARLVRAHKWQLRSLQACECLTTLACRSERGQNLCARQNRESLSATRGQIWKRERPPPSR